MFKRIDIKGLSDEELVTKYRDDEDKRALAELFDRYLRFVFLICVKYLKNDEAAKDMAMQVFEKLTIDLQRFEVTNFKSWLHSVCRNSCLMHLRSTANSSTLSLSDEKLTIQFVEKTAFVHQTDGTNEAQLQQLEKAVAMLEDGQKQCIELFFLQDKSYAEVADITGFSLNQVKSYIQNGKRNLRNYLVQQGETGLLILVVLLING